jgi:hypothetical protein
MRLRIQVGLVTVLVAAALAGCGGDDDNDSGSSSGGGNSASPAETILADAGLEICSTEDEQIAQSTIGPGLSAIRVFDVGKTCPSESSPNQITVYQFDSRESVDNGAKQVAAKFPQTVVLVSGALVIDVSGPQREANADAVGKAYEDSTGSPVETVS